MPFPCCTFCYEKYCDEDGEIISEKLLTLMFTGDDLNEKGKIVLESQPCTCPCHHEGKQILH